MENWFLVLLCFISLVLGWLLSFYYYAFKTADKKTVNLPVDMKHRLQLLFDTYSDESIDKFIQSLEVTSETLSLHLSIGRHFRAQGEVEKAILVHQNLMSHPELSSKASENIIYELAKDYKSAGLFDRAHSLLQQLKDSKQFSLKSLKLILDIHESEKDWVSALKEASRVDLKKHRDLALRVSQYHCELGDGFVIEGLLRESINSYKQAISLYKACYRAYLGLAKHSLTNKDYNDAIQYLKNLISISPEQIILALPLLLEATVKTGTFQGHQQYLYKLLAETGQVPVMLAIVESMLAEGDTNKARVFLFDYLHARPNLTALSCFFKLDKFGQYTADEIIVLIRDVLEVVHIDEQVFKCTSCGFTGTQLHWLCPSCKSWQTSKPVIEYESTLSK